jgi:HK97 family phage portal protein
MGLLSRLESKAADWGALDRYLAWAFGGGVSSSGIVVNPQTALQSAAVYSCVKVLAESVGMLPFNVYREDADGARTLAKDHPLFELLHHQPNDFQTAVEFWEMLVMSLCLRGNGYAYILRAGSGRIVELLPVHPDMVRVDMSADYQLTYSLSMPDGTFKPMKPGEIFHVRGQTINGWLGISPIAYARESIGLALATEKFGGQLFRNGAKMGGTLEHPQKLSQEAYDRLKNSFDAAHSGENAHRTAILEEGLKFNRISMNADDAQFLETRKYQRSEIAGIFRVPAHMINDLEGATFSNIEQQSIDFINKALMPWLRRIEQAARRDLFSAADKKNLHCRFNVAALLRGDASARGTLYHNGILDGWLLRNEVRLMESENGVILNPLAQLDTPLQPLNMVPAGSDPAKTALGTPPAAGK